MQWVSGIENRINVLIGRLSGSLPSTPTLCSERWDRHQLAQVMTSWPNEVIMHVHPEWVEERIAKMSPDGRLHQFNELNNEQQARLASLFPLMASRSRFHRFLMIDLPWVHWRRLIDCMDRLERAFPGITLATCYRSAWLRQDVMERNRSREWLSYKLHPRISAVFLRELNEGTHEINDIQRDQVERFIGAVLERTFDYAE
ncbi:hypothetical protein JXA80_11590 [bacterium]|nr:hypothetical protein [candidate division CSSED10-310 bacterium]